MADMQGQHSAPAARRGARLAEPRRRAREALAQAPAGHAAGRADAGLRFFSLSFSVVPA
jgi:hypothetical protein